MILRRLDGQISPRCRAQGVRPPTLPVVPGGGYPTLADGEPLRFVQSGATSGADLPLPAAVLRSAPVCLLGSGIGSIPLPPVRHAMQQVFNASVRAGLRIATEAVALADVGTHWERVGSHRRTVFVPGPRGDGCVRN